MKPHVYFTVEMPKLSPDPGYPAFDIIHICCPCTLQQAARIVPSWRSAHIYDDRGILIAAVDPIGLRRFNSITDIIHSAN